MPRRGITPPRDNVKALLRSDISAHGNASVRDGMKRKDDDQMGSEHARGGTKDSQNLVSPLSPEQIDKAKNQALFKAELERQIIERKELKRKEAERQRQIEMQEEQRIKMEREKLRRDYEAAPRPPGSAVKQVPPERPPPLVSEKEVSRTVYETRNQGLKSQLSETDNVLKESSKENAAEEGLLVHHLAEMEKLEKSVALSEIRCAELLEQVKSLLVAVQSKTDSDLKSLDKDGDVDSLSGNGQKRTHFMPIVYTVEYLGNVASETFEDDSVLVPPNPIPKTVWVPSLHQTQRHHRASELEASDAKLSLWKRAGKQIRKLSVIKKPGGSENAWMVDGDEE